MANLNALPAYESADLAFSNTVEPGDVGDASLVNQSGHFDAPSSFSNDAELIQVDMVGAHTADDAHTTATSTKRPTEYTRI